MEKLRPHHGLCTNFYVSRGYSSEFTDNMTKVCNNGSMKYVLSSSCDIICAHCPSNVDGRCTTDKPDRYDARVLEFTGLHDGDTLTLDEFRAVTRKKIIDPGLLDEVCGDCRWIELCHGRLDIQLGKMTLEEFEALHPLPAAARKNK